MPNQTLFDVLKSRMSPDVLQRAQLEYEAATISADLLRLAEESGLSRRELARKMGSSLSTVQRIVSETETGNPRLSTLLRFAAACGRKLRVTFDDDKDVNPRSHDGPLLVSEASASIPSHWVNRWPEVPPRGRVSRSYLSDDSNVIQLEKIRQQNRVNQTWRGDTNKLACAL